LMDDMGFPCLAGAPLGAGACERVKESSATPLFW